MRAHSLLRTPPATRAALSALLVLLCCAAPGCRGRRPAAGPPPVEIEVARELGAAYFEEGRLDEAEEALRRVVEWEGAGPQDYVNLACVELARQHFDEESRRRSAEAARRWLERALELDPDHPAAWYCLGVLARRGNDPEEALRCFDRVLERVPQDPAARLLRAVALQDLGRADEAEEELRRVQELGVEYAGSFYVSAIYRLSQLLIRSGDPSRVEEGVELQREKRDLEQQGIKGPTLEELDRGLLGRVRAPAPRSRAAPPPKEPAPLAFEPTGDVLLGQVGELADVAVFDLDGDGDLDVAGCGSLGAEVAMREEGGRFSSTLVAHGGFARVLATDLDNDGRASLLLLPREGGRKPLLLTLVEGRWRDDSASLGMPPPVRAACFVDLDHEGDLDLVLATDEGLSALRNDGAEHPAPVKLARWEAAPGEDAGRFDWVVFLDADSDQDVDLLAGAKGRAPVLFSNLRRGRFEALGTERTGLEEMPSEPVPFDLDHDGLCDLVAPDEGGAVVWRNGGDLRFERKSRIETVEGGVRVEDLDLDGEADLVFCAEDTLRVAFGGLLDGPPPVLDTGLGWSADRPPPAIDADRDGDVDLFVRSAVGGVKEARSGGVPGRGSLRLRLEGRKDNRPAVGAVVEVRAGPLYLHRFVRHPFLTLGLGPAKRPDVVRVTWPNGVVQHSIRPPAGQPLHIVQKEGLVGSCPFLYTCDGERFEFLSDVLGATPLGLPVAEGVFVQPAHREWVRIPGDRLRPRGRFFEVSLTEELREVTYLDRVRLLVVDHDADVEVHPEERFCLPPFPPKRLHAVRRILPVVQATGSDGRDWTREVAEIDDACARPFRPLSGQFLGLATPHFLEVRLPEEVKRAPRVRLLLTGWVFWTDASVNLAASRHPAVSFRLPEMLVPDGAGGWKPSGPPIGFPAGKTKTMVIDVTDRIDREDPRLRIATTMRLYWDCIRVALDEEDAPVRVTELEPAEAVLRYRGFSRPIHAGEHVPERFDYERLRPPPWNQHPGRLTRYGEVTELLLDADDRFCIFSAGDEVLVRFPADALPDRRRGRTFVLDLEGWAKDGDPNSAWADRVEPLPFHGMSGYPYGPDERYPDDEAHRRYRAEWNTRPGRRLLPNLAEPAER